MEERFVIKRKEFKKNIYVSVENIIVVDKDMTGENVYGIPVSANASDMEQGIENGLEVVKFFPAEPAGGLKMIKALAAPYVSLKFMPTGGISPSNVRDYLAYDRIIACGGSWMCSGDLIKAGDFEKIKDDNYYRAFRLVK